jgi:hypothetical protein
MEPVTTFLQMAAAIREMARIDTITIHRIGDHARNGQLVNLEAMRHRKVCAVRTTDLLTDLIPHEHMVRELARVGALVDFPHFSAATRNLHAGTVALVRARIDEVYPTECEVRIMLAAERMSTKCVIGRGDIVGVEKSPFNAP